MDEMDLMDGNGGLTMALIEKHGGYRNLLSYKIATVIYDITVRFCDRFLDPKSRTCDQMIQGARSGRQNIAEGSQASATSRKFELKLTSVARASLEELKIDYEDFLRQRRMEFWRDDDPRRQQLVEARCESADEVANWGKVLRSQMLQGRSAVSKEDMDRLNAEIAANSAHVLIGVTCFLLDRQIASLAKRFEEEGGFTERLYQTRKNHRHKPS